MRLGFESAAHRLHCHLAVVVLSQFENEVYGHVEGHSLRGAQLAVLSKHRRIELFPVYPQAMPTLDGELGVERVRALGHLLLTDGGRDGDVVETHELGGVGGSVVVVIRTGGECACAQHEQHCCEPCLGSCDCFHFLFDNSGIRVELMLLFLELPDVRESLFFSFSTKNSDRETPSVSHAAENGGRGGLSFACFGENGDRVAVFVSFPIKNGHCVERFLWPTPFAAHLHGDGEHEVDEGVQLPTGAEIEARELGVVAFGKRQPDGLSAVVGSHLSVMTG